MSLRRFAVFEASLLLLLSLFANAASRNNVTRIKVLDSETRSVTLDDSGVPKNCDAVNFDAYCHNSKTVQMTNTLLVQDDEGATFQIACTVDTKWSRCVPLPKGESYEAKKEKRGITVYYVDDKGKARSQLYTMVAAEKNVRPLATATPPQNSTSPAPVPRAAAPEQNSSTLAPAPPASAQGSPPAKIRCNFSSTPPGAELTIDFRYVGNTPSEIGLSPGTHVVVISLPGFAEWKRELTVGSDSAVNVAATLQKTQP